MKMGARVFFLLALMLQSCHAFAEATATPCGSKAPEFDRTIQNQEQLKIELQGKAEALSKYFGSADLSARIQSDKNNIYENASQAEAARSLAYYQYIVCVLIFEDKTLDVQKRLTAWKDAQQSFATPVQAPAPQKQRIVDHSTFDAFPSGRGKDKPYDFPVSVPPDLKAANWHIDTNAILEGKMEIHDLGGDRGHCTSYRRETLGPDSFVFYMDLGNVKGHDAHQDCRLVVPVIRERYE